MRLFKRKSDDEPEPVCPACGERVPEDAEQCAMCGEQLGDPAATPPSDDDERAAAP